MSLALSYSPFLLILLLAAAGTLAFWAYRGTVPALANGPRGLLTALRFLALGLLLFLLFEPVINRLLRTERAPVLAVLIDNSRSIPVTSGGASDSAQARLPSALNELIQSEENVEIFRFSSNTTPVSPDSLDSLAFDGPRTNITQALERAQASLRNRNIGGVLLLSDGQYNTGRNPLYTADRYPVPIYTVAVGDTTHRMDLQIYQVVTNEIAYAGNVLPVEVTLRAENTGSSTVQVSLIRDGGVLDRRPVTLPEESGERSLTLEYTPTEPGLHHLEIRVTTLPGEVTTRNNRQQVAVRVLESRKRILLLAAAPGPDVAGISRLLGQNERLTVTSYVQQGPGAFYQGALPDDFSEVDAFVLAGWPGEAAQPATMRRVAEVVEEGAPVVFLMTPQTDLRALAQHLGEVLPLTPQQPADRFAQAQPVLTPEGERHPILQEATNDQFRRLPPLSYSPGRWRASPDARALATVRIRGVELNDPFLVVRNRSGSRSAAWLGAGAWRWATLPQDLQEAAGLWPALLSNLLQWATTPEDDRRVRVDPVRDFFAGGEEIQFTGQVYDESLEPVDDASVRVTITNESGQSFPFEMRPQGAGQYVLEAGTLPEGSYRYTAVARDGETQIGTDEGVFSVGGLTLEFRDLRADVDLLRQIAARSGGRMFFPDSLGSLPSALAASDAYSAEFLEEQRQTPLWHLYGLMFVVIALLTAEWFTRKRVGLV